MGRRRKIKLPIEEIPTVKSVDAIETVENDSKPDEQGFPEELPRFVTREKILFELYEEKRRLRFTNRTNYAEEAEKAIREKYHLSREQIAEITRRDKNKPTLKPVLRNRNAQIKIYVAEMAKQFRNSNHPNAGEEAVRAAAKKFGLSESFVKAIYYSR